MTSLFHNYAIIHHADAIHLLQAAKSVRDHYHGLASSQPLQQGEDMLLGSGIQSFGGFIQQPEIAVMQ